MLLDIQNNDKSGTGTPFWPSAQAWQNTKHWRRVELSISHCVGVWAWP